MKLQREVQGQNKRSPLFHKNETVVLSVRFFGKQIYSLKLKKLSMVVVFENWEKFGETTKI